MLENPDMRQQQLQLFAKPELEYGGSSRKGRRKIQRPFDRKRPLHLVFRSGRAKGAWSFLHRRNKGAIQDLLSRTADRYGVKIYRFENVGNHLHLLAKFPSRRELKAFLRVFTQRVMFRVTGARKGSPQGRFFDAVAYSKVVSWGKEFQALKAYLWKNALEGLGFGREQISRWRKVAKEVPL
jgi:REP element-mobilizing transposase RayT